jgi:hypothetical protein
LTRERTVFILLAAILLASCGGGGGGGVSIAFAISGTTPQDGTVDAEVESAVAITFTLPADLDSITNATIHMHRADGSPVGTRLLKQNFNGSTVRLEPLTALAENEHYRVIISGSILSRDGAPLGADWQICFITTSRTPTVRPDQIIDLGDKLNIPRYLAQHVRTKDGRFFVIGGYQDDATATDTIEEWIPETRSFVLMGVRMTVPRAEHTATLLSNGNVVIAGGVSEPGGEPLASTELFSPSGLSPGPDMNEARRLHAASRHLGGSTVAVSGGFGTGGVELDTAEQWGANSWTYMNGLLPRPTTRHLMFDFDFDKLYSTAGNLDGLAAIFDASGFKGHPEGDIRFRPTAARIGSNRLFIVGGDTRSAVTYDFNSNVTWGATDFLHERRGSHTLTPRGLSGGRFLVAGGFNIAAQGHPPLASIEVVDYLVHGPFGFADASFYEVSNVALPTPFAGHVGFTQADGSTVLAGGWGGETGPHSRRVVLVLDVSSSPPINCSGN